MLRRAMMAQAASGGGGSDPYWANVSSLLHFDDSTTFTDQTGKVWVRRNNPTISTTQSKFGGASGLFAGDQWIKSGPDAAFGFGAGEFTIEGWLYLGAASGNQCLFDNRSGSDVGIAIYASLSSGAGAMGWATNSSATSSGYTIPTSTWTHIAVVRQGTTIRIYVGGVQRYSGTDSRTYASSATAIYGEYYGTSQGFSPATYLDDWRITKGICRYPNGTTFTPPTAAFPDN